jgi:hypothetical protein
MSERWQSTKSGSGGSTDLYSIDGKHASVFDDTSTTSCDHVMDKIALAVPLFPIERIIIVVHCYRTIDVIEGAGLLGQ